MADVEGFTAKELAETRADAWRWFQRGDTGSVDYAIDNYGL